jgi:radical SAM superfamily enzyme YgiQ (UPF0313 family)
MSTNLTAAEELKFELLATGIALAPSAMEHIAEANGDRPLTPADYASTSGVILELEDNVWVNAPIARYNPNFVGDSPYELLSDGGRLRVQGGELGSGARFWLPPAWHDTSNERGEPFNSYGFTHTDRVRVSPVEGCAITCRFCDLPYEFRYRTKRIEGLVETARVAIDDPIQPAAHILISGGTPLPEDYDYLNASYEAVATAFPELSVDVMMVPMEGLLDPNWLAEIGVSELSINLEIYNRDLARTIMPRKFQQGLDHYLDFLTVAAAVFGGERVRSMLMVGLEPMEDTLAGVEAIAARGCTPVLSPFRPDPGTPLRDLDPPSASAMRETYLRAYEITQRYGVRLGPSCIPCAHNTLTFSTSGSGDADVHHGHPAMV